MLHGVRGGERVTVLLGLLGLARARGAHGGGGRRCGPLACPRRSRDAALHVRRVRRRIVGRGALGRLRKEQLLLERARVEPGSEVREALAVLGDGRHQLLHEQDGAGLRGARRHAEVCAQLLDTSARHVV